VTATDEPGRDEARVDALRRELADHRPATPREAAARDRILSELDRLDHPFDEGADPVHVTASAVVVGSRGTVLHRHKRLHIWLQPGGHVDRGESPADAAWREVGEETGLRVTWLAGAPTLVHVDVHPAARGHTHLDLRYALVGPDADPSPPPGESQEVRWFGWDEALSVADGSLTQALRAVRRLVEAGREGS
jgi:8-oxo-dGTP pyrophosphatase MutT (NUDIX family)